MKIAFFPYLTLVAAMLSAPAAVEMKAFPPAGKGMARHVLQLPKEEDESAFKVELTVRVDAGNRVDRCYRRDH